MSKTKPLSVRAMLGEDTLELCITGEHTWRVATLEDPSWLTAENRGDLPLACHLWCMLENKVKGIAGPKDIFGRITDANRKDLWDAVIQCWEIKKRSEIDPKNSHGSTPSPSPASSSV